MAGTQAAFPVQSFPSSAVAPSITAGAGITISTANVISVDNTTGAIGTYVMGGSTTVTGGSGVLVAGSSLFYAGVYSTCAAGLAVGLSGGLSGTWKRMGFSGAVNNATLFLRVA